MQDFPAILLKQFALFSMNSPQRELTELPAAATIFP